MCSACASGGALEAIVPRHCDQTLYANSERPATEARCIEDLLFLSIGCQRIVITVVILIVTRKTYGNLVCFLNSLQTACNLCLHCPQTHPSITVGIQDLKARFYEQS